MANDTVTIANPNKTEMVALNGGMTAGEALANFFRCTARDVENRLAGQMVRLNNATLGIPGDLNQPLRGGDVISLYPNDIARGGVKGARC